MEQGLVEFIQFKIKAGASEESIINSLRVAGLTDIAIQAGFEQARKVNTSIHQDIVAANNFLPPLKKADKTNYGVSTKKVMSVDLKDEASPKGPSESDFFAGRLRRRDFIFGLILVPGLTIIFMGMILTFLKIVSMDAYAKALLMFERPQIIDIVIILAIFSPFIIKMFDLIIRRLHDMNFPGYPSLLMLSALLFFIDFEMIVYQVIGGFLFMFTLFLLTKKGTQGDNIYGEHYRYIGGFIGRIFHR